MRTKRKNELLVQVVRNGGRSGAGEETDDVEMEMV